MTRYLIQAPHTAEQCEGALIELLREGPSALMQFDFTCAVGENPQHLAVAVLDLASEEAARQTLPLSLRDNAVIVEVRKIMPEEVRQLQRKQ